MTKPLDHDEHQFVASGWLIVHQALLPYRDFPYFHLPYLSLVYALAYLFTDHLLLTARLISVCAALGCALLVYRVVRGADQDARATLIAVAAVLLWLLNPLTQVASGLAWNHDTALLFCLLAFAFFTRPQAGRRDDFLSGLCLAVAVGIRATFALPVAAFVAAAWFGPGRARRLLNWTAGLLVGLLPLLLFFLLAPAQFIFGNLTYAALNTEWRFANEYDRAMTLAGKLAYLASDVVGLSSTLFLLVAFGLALLLALRTRLGRPFWLASALSALLFVSAFLPTPTFPQYFYSAIPFIVVSVALACRSLTGSAGVAVMTVLLLGSVWQGSGLLGPLPYVFSPGQWTPSMARQTGAWLREQTGPGTVATLAPIIPLEAGLPIYPELATGPFAYRVGALMTVAERRAQNVFAPDDIDTLLDARAPRGLLLGYEPETLEGPFVDFARPRHFTYQRLPNGKNLWVSP